MVFFTDSAFDNTLLHRLQLQEWIIFIFGVRVFFVGDELKIKVLKIAIEMWLKSQLTWIETSSETMVVAGFGPGLSLLEAPNLCQFFR